ncbi:MAG TPA: peptide chain release factor N(5)-glutamine methyltransferase [Terriglobales bacterium]|nr:peptide chain release factor N(5)-glutamine methyltransferase [Terriglobales bacterium]
MHLREALRAATDFLAANHVGSPRMNAEVLLMHALACDRAYLYAHPEREMMPDEQSRYEVLLAERAGGKPSQYITGHQEFWGLDFIVSPAVLIPRPETEHIVETVLELAREFACPRIVDVGTGSGCIALSLASELPSAEILAVDISPDALEIARANAVRLQLHHRVGFQQRDLLAGFTPASLDFVVSNPPYVAEADPDKVQREVREFEPRVAVFAGESGMEVYRLLIPQAHEVLRPGGWLVVEIGFSIEAAVRDLLRDWSEVQVTADLQGIPRVVASKK